MGREYRQYCPTAYALDLVGERWTLLIVRDLLVGPRRYTDLQAGLPGLASNLLARRLRRLAEAGLVEGVQLPPPAGGSAYTLTERGRELQPVIAALTAWGLDMLPGLPPAEAFVGPVPLRGYLQARFVPRRAGEAQLVCRLDLDPYPLTVRIDAGTIDVTEGPGAAPDVVAVLVAADQFIGVLNRALDLDAVLDGGGVRLARESMRPALRRFCRFFEPVPAARWGR